MLAVERLGMRRAVMFLVLVAVAGFAPASTRADADGLADLCTSLTGRNAGCVLVDRIGSGTAQACRLVLGVSTDACIVPTGDDVSPEAIAAYQAGWTHRALTLQRRLGDDEPLVNSDWVATHNSFNSASYHPTLSGLDPNQQLTLSGQLDLDVRNLELDLHWFPSLSAGGMAPVVCHGQGPVGCTIEPVLRDRLLELRHWLDAHAGAVILLYLEDQLDTAPGYDAAAAAIEEVLGDLVWRPAAGAGCQPMPLGVTRSQVRAAGAQVLVRSSCDGASVTPAWTNLVFGSDGEIEYGNDGSFQPYPACDPQWDRATLQSAYARHYEDSTFVSAAVGAIGGGGPVPLDATTVQAMVRCGIDEVGLDQLVPGDPRLEAYVWSWAANEPSMSTPGTCASAGPDGRFVAWPCGTPLRAACIDPATAAWSITATAVSQADGEMACSDAVLGSRFAVPRTGYSASLLHDAMAAAGVDRVWLRYAVDSDGVWSA